MKAQELLDLLKEVEWEGEGGYREENCCPSCGAHGSVWYPGAHEEGCALAQAIIDLLEEVDR